MRPARHTSAPVEAGVCPREGEEGRERERDGSADGENSSRISSLEVFYYACATDSRPSETQS